MFSGRGGSPQFRIYGNLVHLLPQFDATPTLDLFLYGPNDEGKTLIQNAQGMTPLGDLLLVCDQGRPDVIAVNVTNGKSVGWTDRHRAPRCPVDICTDGDRVFVADTTNRSVIEYTSAGKFVTELIPPSSVQSAPLAGASSATDPHAADSGTGTPAPVRAFRPAAVCVGQGMLYAGDMAHHRIERYDLSRGQWLEPLTPPTGYPRIAAPSGLAFSSDGTLHIVDSLQQRVLRMSVQGKWLDPIGRPGRGPGQFVRPKSICCTSSGLVLVTDAGRQSVLVFQSDGTSLTEIHETRGWKGFTLPAGIVKLQSAEALSGIVSQRGWPASDEYIAVSDSMGGIPLVLLGTSEARREGAARAE